MSSWTARLSMLPQKLVMLSLDPEVTGQRHDPAVRYHSGLHSGSGRGC